MDEAPVTPEVTASWFSFLFFNWISPMMALGSRRPLQAEDLWKMDDARGAELLSNRLMANFVRRQQEAKEFNERLQDPNTPLPRWTRFKFALSSRRAEKEKEYREKTGLRKASLAWTLNDVFGRYFWIGVFIKWVGDCSGSTMPLLMRALLQWVSDYQNAPAGEKPSMGSGVGMAIGMLLMLSFYSMSVHHFFIRSMGTGVLSRSALISAIFNRSLRFTQKSRGILPNGKLVNHISTDTSRIDFAAGFFGMLFTAPLQFLLISAILLVEIQYSALPGIAFLAIAMPLQMGGMKRLFAFRKKSMLWTDKRAKLLQEILGGMRIVKFMAWESPFLARLQRIRGLELGYVRQLMLFRSGMMAFAMSLPTLAAILSFVTYSLSNGANGNFKSATLFSVITLFQLMRMPLMIWPITLSSAADAINALGRLEVVFEAEIITESREIDPSIEEGLIVADASFTWDAAPIVEDDKMMRKLEGKGKKNDKVKKGDKDKKKRKFRWNKKQKKVELADQLVAEVAAGGTNNLAEAGTATNTGEQERVEASGPASESLEAADVSRIFQIRDVNINVPRGSLTAVVGPIGSGKSSLLQGLMGEMRRTSGKVIFSGSTALCAQTPWIQNATVRENILFGQPWDEERYWAAVRDSCLEADLEMLDDGDGTEIGEKGINLSGGQKQRVNIARAIYFNADIIALDDPLSALDAGVGKALFFNAILGALSGKTRLLVTHALHFLPYVDNILFMDEGRVVEQGTYNELKAQDGAFARLIRDFGSEEQAETKDENEEEAIENSGPIKKYDRDAMIASGTARSLMQGEERNTGALAGKTWMTYFRAGRGAITVPLLLFSVALAQGFTVMTNFWLAYWEERKWGQSNGFFMGVYAALGIGSALSLFFQGGVNAFLTYGASVRLHRDAIKRVMFAPQSFFDTTPLGRIMNRFAKDIDTLDNTLGDAMRMAVQTCGNIIGATILVAIIEPYFLIAMAVVMVIYAHNAAFYRRSSREFKRIDAILRSSLYSHFSESLSGISTIRSYGESERFLTDNWRRMDIENRAYYLTIINQRWLGIRLDFLGSLLTFVVAIILVCSHRINATGGGLGLSTMVTVQQSFSWMVRQLAEVENDMVGAERIMHYANELEQEAPHHIDSTKPPANWPARGAIEFNNVRMKYRPELPDVLKGLTLSVGGAEKIGVVGRTGAGKSSIMISLFRMVELSSGNITIDGVDLSKIGLNDLRSGISIIPQDPLLFSGTLRSNIDPFSTKSDAELYDALKRAHLVASDSELQVPGSEGPNGMAMTKSGARRFTLDTVVEEEGGNLSVGERSLVSLARALVRDTKVLVLDEATASVDVETDSKIQSTIRTEFKDRTLLCIAHRLRTILSYDRILVMADGKVEELDTPENLFLSGGAFRGMCEHSNIDLADIRAAAALRF